MVQDSYDQRVYAGVLGKIIGVYLGRPVEGWPYAQIQERFGLVDHYVNEDVGAPLVVADDDISGTFAFGRSVSDHPGGRLRPTQVGDTWLNYIIEDRTILWWGGLGRSTEHTAFLNLKNGIEAPRSGSITQNGATLAEQIGAQIFSDAFALMAPGDPDRAVALTRAAASVSHDGDALESAALLAAMRSLAFRESDLDVLLDSALEHVTSPKVHALVDAVRLSSGAHEDWRDLRTWVDRNYGYHLHPGPCHSLSNLAMSLAALLSGGDNFLRAVAIASSVGFDTDSNAGTVGCLNGVRLGLAALTADTDLRGPVADRLLVVTADGGECVSDAVREAHKIIDAAAGLDGSLTTAPARPRFSFPFPGSVQGFSACPHVRGAEVEVTNVHTGDHRALRIEFSELAQPTWANVSTPTFLDPADDASNFSTLASPTLYPGQRVDVDLSSEGSDVQARLYALYEGADGLVVRYGDVVTVSPSRRSYSWLVPAVGNLVPFRLGISAQVPTESRPPSPHAGAVLVHFLSWDGAPELFEQQGVLLTSIWDTRPRALRPWVASAKNFEADFGVTYSVSHPERLGVVTTGSRDWLDYSVSSRLMFSLHEAGGVVMRSRGHRRFTGALFTGGDRVLLVSQHDGVRKILAQQAWPYDRDRTYDVTLTCIGDIASLAVDGKQILIAATPDVLGGGAGFLVERGTVLADGFRVVGLP